MFMALSMGKDSLALSLQLLKNPSFVNRITLIHVNHNYILEDSKIQAKFEQFVKQFDLPYIICNNTLPNDQKESGEAYCHRVRQYYFKQILDENDNLITAHTIDDAVESYLMNCLRGKPDYCPIAPYTQLEKGRIVRPAILVSKESLHYYLPKTIEKEFVYEDPMNNSSKSMRNWVRKELIPVIGQKYRGLNKVVRKLYNTVYTESSSSSSSSSS